MRKTGKSAAVRCVSLLIRLSCARDALRAPNEHLCRSLKGWQTLPRHPSPPPESWMLAAPFGKRCSRVRARHLTDAVQRHARARLPASARSPRQPARKRPEPSNSRAPARRWPRPCCRTWQRARRRQRWPAADLPTLRHNRSPDAPTRQRERSYSPRQAASPFVTGSAMTRPAPGPAAPPAQPAGNRGPAARPSRVAASAGRSGGFR